MADFKAKDDLTVKTPQIVSNVKGVCADRLLELNSTFSKDSGKNKEDATQLLTYAAKEQTDKRHNSKESVLEVKCIDKKRLSSDRFEQRSRVDSHIGEQLNTPVTTDGTKKSVKKPGYTDEKSPDLKYFINFLELDEYYPDKMQVKDVMKVEHLARSLTYKEIALMFVRNIITINLKGRDKLLKENLGQQLETDQIYSREYVLENIVRNKARARNREVNPLDLTIAVFKCASPMLKHTLASKFFTCQLAVPFAFPTNYNEDISISLIPLYSIVIECTSNGKYINEVSLNCPCHVVSFCRFGNLSVSKSKLVNEILNDQYHDTFFDRDCPLGSSNRCISEGLIEAAWYLPSRKSNFMSSVTTFLNLRGDAKRFHQQLKFLSTISSILVILIDVNGLDENMTPSNLVSLLDNVHKIIIAIDAYRSTEIELKEKCRAFSKRMKKHTERIQICIIQQYKKPRSSADIKIEMRNTIKMLVDTKPLSPILLRLKSSNLKIKDDIGYYRDVQQNVLHLWDLFPHSCSDVKPRVIPVQGKHWETWTKNMKKSLNTSLYKSPTKVGKIKKIMNDERMKQVKLCHTIGPFMRTFIDSLLKFCKNENECHAFVILVKYFLDDRSRRMLPEFQSQYLTDWETLKIAKENNSKETDINELSFRVSKSEKELNETYVGIEHLYREFGQIYEALSDSETKRTDQKMYVDDLPKIAARLLFMGQPFELMDGDVTNVPLIWIKAVFLELKELIGDRKVLVISVLGIQNSGKSTLLNTMFGSQFAISAFRCTKGVYAQLMTVESVTLPFEYVLVIDTEGLRALKLADFKKPHDNQLATFVVGLGDITIVNVKGENTTEVKDVLQIVVHAFLRLKLTNKKSNLKPRCIFAHQNVPAQDANEKMRHRRQKFIETLDQMTKEAAAQENIADIQTFNQIIQLDIEKDVLYFPDLWLGDPPMAPANPGYSETAADALKAITQRLIFERETYLTITDTVTRIGDLWTGILKDDFVFSFRNCLEIKAFNDMERHYHSLTSRLELTVHDFIKADAKSTLMTCDHPDEFDIIIQNNFIKLSKIVNDCLDEGTKQLDSFMENSCLKDVMTQWQLSKHRQFKLFGEELIEQAKIDIHNTKTELKIMKQRRMETKHELEINRQAEVIAFQMKGSLLNKAIIQQAFEKMWNGWISQFDTKVFQHVSSLKEQIELLIHNRFSADVVYLSEVDDGPFLDDIPYNSMNHLENHFVVRYIKEEHFSIHSKYFDRGNRIPIVQLKVQVIEVVNNICRQIDSRLSDLQVQDIKFSTAYVSEIFSIICNAIDNHNANANNWFHFNLTSAFRACICTYVKRYLVVFFEKLDEKYNGKHSPKAIMAEYKGTVWKLFTNTVESKAEDAIAVDLLRDVIIKEMVRIISQMMPIDVQSYILKMYPFRKIRLIKDILTNLAENEDFSDIKSYIQDPLVFSTKWIKDVTNKTLFDDREDGCTLYANFAKARIQNLFPKIAKAIFEAYETCKMDNYKTISQWIDFFVRNMNQNKIPISKDTMVHVKYRHVSKLDSFIEILRQQLEDIKNKVTTIFENTSENTVLWDENPVPKIMLKLWGCSETCPFCKEPCINTDKDHVDLGHDHECLQHRPQGIGGYTLEQTNKFCVAYCNHLVGTEQTYIWNRGAVDEERRKFREYKKHFPDWGIPHSLDKCQFWRWIMCKYKDELIEMYCTDLSDIPESWPLITKQQALESLSVYMAD